MEAPYELRLKDGSSVRCSSNESEFSLSAYYFLSHRFGVYSSNKITKIHELTLDLGNKMSNIFTEDEISRCSPSASANFSLTLMALYTIIRKVKPETAVQTGF
jgi:hypothetical protein